jgi:hypothetical protein
VVHQSSRAVLKNKVMEAVFEKHGTSARLAAVTDGAQGITVDFNSPLFVVRVNDRLFASDEMQLEGQWKVEDLAGNREATKLAERFAGKTLTAVFRDHASGLKADWRVLLRDGSNYIRQEISFSSEKPLKLETVTLLKTSLDGAVVKGTVAGSPIVTDCFFMGFEHPLAENVVSGSKDDSCSYARHTDLKGETAYTCSSVIGVYPDGQLRRAFLCYLERERAHPYRQYLHYNTWYDLNIDRPKNRMTEKEALDAVNAIGTELVSKRGVVMEGFVMDDGWDSHESVWDFHEHFPNGFDGVGKAAASYQAGVGVWMSPWGGYGDAQRSRMEHGKKAGFETNKSGFSMAGRNYREHFENTCFKMMDDYGVNHFKFDGMGGGMSATGAQAELADDINAILDMAGSLRDCKKDVWINATVGTWPSPFWTRYADSIWRQGGDVSFVGVGSKREQWITYRDMVSYRSIVRPGPLYPLNSLMFHGVVIGARHHPGQMELCETSVRHEIRAAFGCGSGLQELYITPELLTKQMWDDLADSAKWARSNSDVMTDTHWVGGDPGKLEVYGWASWNAEKGVLALRNPNETAQTYKLDIGKAFELPKGAQKAYTLASPFKDQRMQTLQLKAGKAVAVSLDPFEVLVFDATPQQPPHRAGLPGVQRSGSLR